MSQTQGQPGMGAPPSGMSLADRQRYMMPQQAPGGGDAIGPTFGQPGWQFNPTGFAQLMNQMNQQQNAYGMQPQPPWQQGYGPGGSQAGIAAQRDQILADQGGGDITSLVGRVAQNQPQMGGNAMMSQGRK